MIGYIYKTTILSNGKIYIGKKESSTFIKDYYGSGKLIKRALDKYGIENASVEIIDTAKTLTELNDKEVYYIDKYNSRDISIGYNIANGGDGGNIISTLPDKDYQAFIKKCRLNNTGKKNPNFNNGDKIRGEKNPSKRPEIRAKLSKILSGEGNGMYGKKQTPEAIKKRIEKSKANNNGKFPNQFTNNPNAKHWRDKEHYLYDGDVLLHTFKNKIKLINYCRSNNITKKMVLDCLDNNIYLKDVLIYKGSKTKALNEKAKENFPMYNFTTIKK